MSSKDLSDIVKNQQVIAVICNQWGDTGKGKFSDYFAKNWADVIARGTGGANAGHSVILKGEEVVFHLIPSGITYDSLGKKNILGNGMVIDPFALQTELFFLDEREMSYNNLWISEDATLTMPWHVKKDLEKNKSLKNGGIGSTGKGIGPTYSDKIGRRQIKFKDLLNKDVLAKKVKKNAANYPSEDKHEIEATITQYANFGKYFKPLIRDTIAEINQMHKQGKNILLEGAQGLLLSIEYGASPYVTSSDPSIYGTAQGVGVPFRAVDLTLGIAKFPYMTRVGGGPFPTEHGGRESEKHCEEPDINNMKSELEKYNVPFKENNENISYDGNHPNILSLKNSTNEFENGVGLRLAGREYGATTKRPRRTGWTDLVALSYAVDINGPDLILTKPDVLQGADSIKLCVGYEIDGTKTMNFSRDPNVLYKAKPIIKEFEGFIEDISKIDNFNDLPNGLKKAVRFTEQYVGANVKIISTGPKAEQTIIR